MYIYMYIYACIHTVHSLMCLLFVGDHLHPQGGPAQLGAAESSQKLPQPEGFKCGRWCMQTSVKFHTAHVIAIIRFLGKESVQS